MLWTLANQIFIPDENGELSPIVQTDLLKEMPSTPPGDFGIAFVKMFATFIALIALLIISYWFIRHLIHKKLQKGVGNQAIQILEKRIISAKTMLYLVEVENKKILLAESHLEIKRLESFMPAEGEPAESK